MKKINLNNNLFCILFFILFLFAFSACSTDTKKEAKTKKQEVEKTIETEKSAPEKKLEDMTYSEVAQAMLMAVKTKANTDRYVDFLAKADREKLKNELNTDKKKLAFWINAYNAYIPIILSKNPDLYKDRNAFFKKDQITIADYTMSFDKMEHGLIRSSTVKLSKGYVPDIFPGKFEKEFAVDDRDGRIHFVLNCGAKDCPPIYIYDAATLDRDFDKVAGAYLNKVSTFDKENNTVKTTPLFQWFTGDFGVGKGAVKDMLAKYKVIPAEHDDVDVAYVDYDWTLDIGNFGNISLR